VHVARGNDDEARRCFESFAEAGISADVQERAMHAVGQALLLSREGRYREALETVQFALASGSELGRGSQGFREGFVIALEAAFAAGDVARVESLLEELDAVPRGKVPTWLRAHAARFRAKLAALRGDVANAEAGLKRAAATFREISTPFPLAIVLLEHGELLLQEGRADEARPLLAEARERFDRLRAVPWIERVDIALAPERVPAS
jgi:tetratricopeptide (TPR) repeat protein